MIRSLTVTNSLGESLTMELFNPWKNGIAIKNIDGMGTPDYVVNMSAYGYGDGSSIGSVRAESRNVIIELYPMFNPQVEDSRQLLYRYFQVKKPIILTFNLDNRVVMLEGYLERNIPDVFSKLETIQISIICPDPYFHEAYQSESFFFGRIPMFEFPFSNDSITEKLITIAELSIDNRAQIDYNAEVDTGVLITIDVQSPPGDITIYNIDTLGSIHLPSDKIQLITGAPLTKDDRVEINTVSGTRYIRLLREGIYHNILGAVNKDIDWFQLQQGPNTYTYRTADEHATIIMTFQYRNTYASI